jgi:hypothetical protein
MSRSRVGVVTSGDTETVLRRLLKRRAEVISASEARLIDRMIAGLAREEEASQIFEELVWNGPYYAYALCSS